MGPTTKQKLREKFNKLKKALDNIWKYKKEQPMPQYALQPYRNKRNLRGTDPR